MKTRLLANEKPVTIHSIDGIALDARLSIREGSNMSLLLVHGFGVDLHEEGSFDLLEDVLLNDNASVARFSFRGHGTSAGTPEGMTIAGERLDLAAAYKWMTRNLPPPYAIVAASFGAVSTLLQLPSLCPRPDAIALWNPVLDLNTVFVAPTTPWGRKNFGNDALEKARQSGYSTVDEGIRVGHVFLEETRLYTGNLGVMYLTQLPVLVIHGTEDSYVPIASSRQLGGLSNVHIVEIPGADHGFPDKDSETIALSTTRKWLKAKLA